MIAFIAWAAFVVVVGVITWLWWHFLGSDKKGAQHASGLHTYPRPFRAASPLVADAATPLDAPDGSGALPGPQSSQGCEHPRRAGELVPLPPDRRAVYQWSGIYAGDNARAGAWPNDRSMAAYRAAIGTGDSVRAATRPSRPVDDTTSFDRADVELLTRMLGADPWDGKATQGAYLDWMFAGIAGSARRELTRAGAA
jgi:hypothetical protein